VKPDWYRRLLAKRELRTGGGRLLGNTGLVGWGACALRTRLQPDIRAAAQNSIAHLLPAITISTDPSRSSPTTTSLVVTQMRTLLQIQDIQLLLAIRVRSSPVEWCNESDGAAVHAIWRVPMPTKRGSIRGGEVARTAPHS